MGSFLWRTAKLFALIAAGALWAGAVSVLLGPRLFDWIEAGGRRPLGFEQAVRIYILAALGLFLAAWLAFIVRRLTVARLFVWLMVATGSTAIAAVCWLDQRHHLRQEESWIRCTTAACLFLTGLAAAAIARRYSRLPHRSRRSWLWCFLTLVFFALGYDELQMVHEWIGQTFRSPVPLPTPLADALTLAYAAAAVLFLGGFLMFLSARDISGHERFLQLLAAGICVFAVSPVCDNFDYLVHDWLRSRARTAGSYGGSGSTACTATWSASRRDGARPATGSTSRPPTATAAGASCPAPYGSSRPVLHHPERWEVGGSAPTSGLASRLFRHARQDHPAGGRPPGRARLRCEDRTCSPQAVESGFRHGDSNMASPFSKRGTASDMLPPATSVPQEPQRMTTRACRRFGGRRIAGRELARALVQRRYERPVVLGIPAGGVVLAAEVAKTLDAELGVVVVRKLEAPYQPGLTLGAVTADNVSWVHGSVAEEVGATESYLSAEIVRRAEEARRLEEDLGPLARPPLDSRTAILVADGIVTGARALAALRSAAGAGASRAVLAAAAGSPEAFDRIRDEAFEAVSLEEDPHFVTIADYFDEFPPVSSHEVRQLLEAAHQLPVC